MSNVIEVVMYQLRPEVTDEQMLALSTLVQGWLTTQPGYIRRELAKNEEGRWLDLVHWRTMREAKQAAEQINQQPFAAQMGAIFEGAEMTILHLHTMQTFEPVA